ncbi:TIGR03905 family TSCPD domain-containing protein [uncultured Ilyobacter sp.]|uniref:TIGR03905 family TSCPD domain-containing protein n=1 Tax=uncultured Ilyobacter sp. TaxID=544433 RepID=UPI0029C6B3C4|nr:TIGR03905 family TSCPD domain-containing protein [uncultured Ilyobacter sp.]
MKTFKTSGVCAREISFKVDGDIIESVVFKGGCSGNTQGLSALLAGMKVDDVVERLSGMSCGAKETSCPDQLAKALKEML